MSSDQPNLDTAFSKLRIDSKNNIEKNCELALDGIIIYRDGSRYTVMILDHTYRDCVYLDNEDYENNGLDIYDKIKIQSIVDKTITKYIYSPKKPNLVLAVAEVLSPSLVTLVGVGFPKPVPARYYHKYAVKEHDLVMAMHEQMRYKTYKICRTNTSDTLESRLPSDGTNTGYVTRVRALTTIEMQKIMNPALLKDISYSLSLKYIRNPLVALGRLCEHVEREREFPFIVEKCIDLPAEKWHNKKQFKIILNQHEADRCIRVNNEKAWSPSVNLYLKHSALMIGDIEYALQVYIGKIEELKHGARVYLTIPECSQDLLRWIEKSNEIFDKEPFKIGTAGCDSCSSASVIEKNFEKFYNNRTLFEQCYGISSGRTDDLDIVPFISSGPELDETQKKAAQASISTPGFTTISAPPGSGKTTTIAAILCNLGASGDFESVVCVCATTNAAVENAIDKTRTCSPKFPVYRDFSESSVRGKFLSQETMNSWLKTVISRVNRHMKNQPITDVNEDLKKALSARHEIWNSTADSLEESLIRMDSCHAANQRVKEETLDCLRILALGATVSMMTRSIRPNVERLILDETGMMSCVDALALYCTMPELTQVTLFGDSKQLQPFCLLNEDSFSYSLLRRSELARLDALACTKKQKLNTVYRCHPRIVKHILRPIYGKDLKAGVGKEQRNMADEMKFPVAEDKSPFVFIHIEGSSSVGLVNQTEIDTVMLLMNKLNALHDECYEDMAVICHHKAQRASVKKRFENEEIYFLDVNTIDSFQGKEAKIVLVLMTKTVKEDQDAKKALSFVSNWNRETVAVSRAQHVMYLFGDWEVLLKTEFWAQYKKMIRKTGCMVNMQLEQIEPDFLN